MILRVKAWVLVMEVVVAIALGCQTSSFDSSSGELVVKCEECVCQEQWGGLAHAPNCEAQKGCPQVPCDNKTKPWCVVSNPGCRTAQGEAGSWAYCTSPTSDSLHPTISNYEAPSASTLAINGSESLVDGSSVIVIPELPKIEMMPVYVAIFFFLGSVGAFVATLIKHSKGIAAICRSVKPGSVQPTDLDAGNLHLRVY
jgi:hypothetical protein